MLCYGLLSGRGKPDLFHNFLYYIHCAMTIDTYGLQGFLQWSYHAVKEKAAVEALAQAAFRALQR